jgi:hypothetical protein
MKLILTIIYKFIFRSTVSNQKTTLGASTAFPIYGLFPIILIVKNLLALNLLSISVENLVLNVVISLLNFSCILIRKVFWTCGDALSNSGIIGFVA